MIDLNDLDRLEKAAHDLAESAEAWLSPSVEGLDSVERKFYEKQLLCARSIPGLLAELRTLRQENAELKGAKS